MAKKKEVRHLAPIVLGFKVKKNGLEVTYIDSVLEGEEDKPVKNEITALLKHEPHPDLHSLVKDLGPHLAYLCEYADPLEFETLEDAQVENLQALHQVRGVQFKEGNGWIGVQIHGHRVLESKKVVNVLAPLVKFQTGAESYPLADHLEERIHEVREEVEAYIGGRRAAPGQLTFGFGAKSAPADPTPEGEDGNGDEE